MNRRGFIASFVAAIVAAALTLRMFRGLRQAPPEPEVNELPKYQTITGDEDAAILPWSRVRSMNVSRKQPANPPLAVYTEEYWRELVAKYGDPWEKNYPPSYDI
jgi:hypothetical protein